MKDWINFVNEKVETAQEKEIRSDIIVGMTEEQGKRFVKWLNELAETAYDEKAITDYLKGDEK